MASYSDLGFASYPAYLAGKWWRHLKIRCIYKNKHAKCWITGSRSHLVLHHENYDHMGQERLGTDIFTLAFKWHRWLHYYFYFFGKVPLTPKHLRSRRFFLKAIYCILKFNIVLFVWYIVRSAITLSEGIQVQQRISYKDKAYRKA